MPTPDNATVARTFHEAWDERNPDRGAAVIADDCEFVDVPRSEIQRGPEGYRQDYERWRTAFPDGTVKITNVITEGDWVVVEFTNSGTNTGPLRTAVGVISPRPTAKLKSHIAVLCKSRTEKSLEASITKT